MVKKFYPRIYQIYLSLCASVREYTLLCVCHQILSKEEYAGWLRRHLEAETAIQGREELLFESAMRLETNLHLLGKSGPTKRLTLRIKMGNWDPRTLL